MNLGTNISNQINIVDSRLKTYCKRTGINPPISNIPFEKILTGKLRFKDDNGEKFSEWKNLKLKDLLVEHKSSNKENKYSEVFSVAKEKGIINQVKHLGRSYASDDISNYKVVFQDDIVYTKSPTASFPFGIIKQNKTERIGVVSVLYAVFKPKNKDIGFLIDFYFNSSVHTFNYLRPIVNKGAKNTMNINNDIFLNGDYLFFPTDEKEIKLIVDFVKTLQEKEKLIKGHLKLMSNYNNGILQTIF